MTARRRLSGAGKPCHYCLRNMLESKTHMSPEDRSLSCTIDHMHSKDLGGTNDSYNLIFACARCNCVKGSAPYSVFMEFARCVIRPNPNATTVVLRRCWNIYLLYLAESAMSRHKDVSRAIRMTLLKMSEEIDRCTHVYNGKSKGRG